MESAWGKPALLLGFILFFHWKVLFTNRIMIPWDAADFFYPYLSFVHEELRHFRLPLWDPYVLSGYPIIGDLEAQIFYPINWLFVLVNPFSPLPYKLVEMQIILHFFLAGLFMYWLARDFVRHEAAALFAAVLYMCGGAMVAHTQHLASINAVAWYPLIFLLARRALLERNFFYSATAGIVFGIQTLAGHWQHSVYLGLLLFLFFAYEACCEPLRKRLWPHWIFLLLVIAGVGAALAMVQVIPTRELGYLSVRSDLTYWDVTQGNEPIFLWTLFVPNFFGGLNGVPQWYPNDLSFNYVFLTVPGCLLAVAGLVDRMRRRDFFWIAMLLLCVELSLGSNGHLAAVISGVPLLNLFRNAPTFFDLANFALCLMAAVGAQALFSNGLSRGLRQGVSWLLAALLSVAVAVGLLFQLGGRIPGWYHLLAVLAVFAAIVTARLRERLDARAAQWAVLGLTVFQLIHFNMNQKFNWSIDNPRTYLSYETAVHRSKTLEFLRSDRGNDFRVAAIAEFQWSGNGWNVWRIPTIFGWNPITLRRYEHYIRSFTHTSDYTLPYGGYDHNFNSGMFDLLGTKYLLVAGSELEQELQLRASEKFEYVFDDLQWWLVYRNKYYLSRAWYYPQAYVVADESEAMAVMSSDWFQARRTLLLEKGTVRGEGAKRTEELSVITLRPDQVAAASHGSAVTDPYCAEQELLFGYWGGKGTWFRYEVSGPPEPGRYLLLMRYTAAAQSVRPRLQVEVVNGDRQQRSGPVSLPRTYEWPCYKTRVAELGEFEITPGMNQITVTSLDQSEINVYTLWLVRLPASAPSEAASFSFHNFSYSANQIALEAHLSEAGFVLLNEIYYPGWEALLDGEPVEILRANGIFRALRVPAGTHQIVMRFRPRYFAWGAAISLLTLCAYLAWFVVRRRRAARPSQPPSSL